MKVSIVKFPFLENVITCCLILLQIVDIPRVQSETLCPKEKQFECDAFIKYRSLDGSCNNPDKPTLGMSNRCVARLLPPDYGSDLSGYSTIREAKSGLNLPNERFISNKFMKAKKNTDDAVHSLMLMSFGQFITEMVSFVEPIPDKIDLRPGAPQFPCCELRKHDYSHCSAIQIDPKDEFYKDFNYTCINNMRADDCGPCQMVHDSLGSDTIQVRRQISSKNAFVDLSSLYGESTGENSELRVGHHGLLLTSKDAHGRPSLLPKTYDMVKLDRKPQLCLPRHGGVCFASGNGPFNQNIGYVSLVTLWHLQHNRIAIKLSSIYRDWDDEKIFQEARRILIAQMQHVTYSQYLPLILGEEIMTKYGLEVSKDNQGQSNNAFFTEYNPDLNPTLTIEFSTAAFRFGHSSVHESFLKVFPNGSQAEVPLAGNYFNPTSIYESGLDSFLKGLTVKAQQTVDQYMSDSIRNHLFQVAGGSFGLDLSALNINRGRENGLQGYVKYIQLCDNRIIGSYYDLSDYIEMDKLDELREIYGNNVEDIDLWVGGLAERHVKGGIVGPTFACIIGKQFARYKFGDRYYYEHGGMESSFTQAQLRLIKQTKLSGIVCHVNQDETNQMMMQDNVMKLSDDNSNPLIECAKHFDLASHLENVEWN